MFGIIFYSGLAYGLGGLLPGRRRNGDGETSEPAVIGSVLLILAAYLGAVVLALPLLTCVIVLAILAGLGWLRLVVTGFEPRVPWQMAAHPAVILPCIGVAAVVVRGGVDYQPYLGDEFTNWIGVSRIIHWAGSYDAVRETIYLPGYTPAWRLLVVLPWQVGGTIESGWSAAAPLILHIAVLVLIYDLAVLIAQRDVGLPAIPARLIGWLALAVFLSAETMGRLWTYELLPEQPQIYLLSIAALLLLRAELIPGLRRRCEIMAGLALAAGFLVKNAIAASAFGAAAVALVPILAGPSRLMTRLRDSATTAAILLGPLLAAVLSWSAIAPPDGCLSSPIGVLLSGIPPHYDPLDMASRFTAAVAGYVGTYKLPLTLAALAGFALGAYVGLVRGPLFWLGFVIAYVGALYWYHLGCLNDYYYAELNSVPRFMRVPLQVFHTLGLILLAVAAVRLARRRPYWPRLSSWIGHPATMGLCFLILATAGAWQFRQAYRTVVDLSTRAYQNVDPRIAEMRQAAEFVRRHAGQSLPMKPRLSILGQGQDGDVRGYAAYFALQPAPGGAEAQFDIHPRTSWAPTATNAWQVSASAEAVIQELSTSDLLWPVSLDAWLVTSVLAPLISDPACVQTLPTAALMREAGNPVRFRCVSKSS